MFAAVFNAFKGAYTFQLPPSSLDTYLAIITIRHPNVSTSFAMSQFNITVVPNAAAAVDTSVNSSSTAATAAAPMVLFNPLVNPKLVFSVTLPYLAAATYSGGQSKLLADFNGIVAGNAGLDGPAWVESSVFNSAPVTIQATVSGCSQCGTRHCVDLTVGWLDTLTATRTVSKQPLPTPCATGCDTCRPGSPVHTPPSRRPFKHWLCWTTTYSCSTSCLQ